VPHLLRVFILSVRRSLLPFGNQRAAPLAPSAAGPAIPYKILNGYLGSAPFVQRFPHSSYISHTCTMSHTLVLGHAAPVYMGISCRKNGHRDRSTNTGSPAYRDPLIGRPSSIIGRQGRGALMQIIKGPPPHLPKLRVLPQKMEMYRTVGDRSNWGGLHFPCGMSCEHILEMGFKAGHCLCISPLALGLYNGG
jgi:hypothetical protein